MPPEPPAWWSGDDDPWLTTRMRDMAAIAADEARIGEAVRAAMKEFLDAARAGVLGDEPDGGAVTAAVGWLPPDWNGWPDESVWKAALERIVRQPISDVFGERFAAATAGAVIKATPWALEWFSGVWDRLKIWPKEAFEEIRPELMEGISEGEDHRSLRARVGAALRIDAPSRRIQADINALTKTIDNPDTPAGVRREARARRSALYRRKDVEDQRWWYFAARIARTETMMARNAGTFHGAKAWQEVTNSRRYKQWWSTSDDRVRSAHWASHMQVMPLDSKFRVGGFELDHPGDPTGPAHLIINCRCSLLTMAEAEARREQERYEKFRTSRTDNQGRLLDEDGQVITAAVDNPGGHMGPQATATANPASAAGAPAAATAPAPGAGAGAGDDAGIGQGTVSTETTETAATATPESQQGQGVQAGAEGAGTVTAAEGDATGADGTDDAAEGDGAQQVYWRGTLAPLGVRSGDGRMIAEPPDGKLDARNFPQPLLYQRALSGGHREAVIAANIESAWIENGVLMGEGRFDMGTDEAQEVTRQIREGFHRWVSVDLDMATFEYPCFQGDQEVSCGTPDDDDLLLLLGLSQEQAAQLKSTRRTMAAELPEPDPDGEDVVMVEVARTWRLMGATLVSQPAFQEAQIEIVDALLHPPGTMSVAAASDAAVTAAHDPAPEDVPAQTRRESLGELVAAAGPWRSATLVASAAPVRPPADWFNNPNLTGPTALTIGEDGRLYGHAALWDTCHVGYPGRCVTPPKGADYSLFHTGAVRVAEDVDVPVGVIVLGTDHASVDRKTTVAEAMGHYAHSGFGVAVVRAGEDRHGVWVAGATTPDLDELRLAALRRCKLSGDWRTVSGRASFIAALAVNTPGFPVPRRQTDANGEVVALVAAGVMAVADASTTLTGKPVKASQIQVTMPSPQEWARGVWAENRALQSREQQVAALASRVYREGETALAARVYGLERSA